MALYSPVAGNQDGSYLTMWSVGGLQFEIIFFFSAVAQMVVDQSYWQSAIAAKPTAAVKVPAPANAAGLPPRVAASSVVHHPCFVDCLPSQAVREIERIALQVWHQHYSSEERTDAH